MLPDASPNHKILVLGTALWGWGIDRPTAYQMLDRFLELGGRIVDTAANYPINKRPEDFGLASTWLTDWIKSNGTKELSVIVKVGATNNMGSPSADLGAANILHSEAFYRDRFKASLAALAIHWDNRGDDERSFNLIEETVDTMARIQDSGLSIGFSGVLRPDLYLKFAPDLSDKWWIQVKENVMSSAARLEYKKYFPKAKYLAYGINMGGLKSEPSSEDSSLALRGIKCPINLVKQLTEFITSNHGLVPAPKNLNDLALSLSYLNPELSGIVIGPRNIKQIDSTICFWNRLITESSPSMVTILPKFS